jgi:beta-galactosidase
MNPLPILGLFILGTPPAAPTFAPARERLLFDRDWRFAFGNAVDRAKDFDPFPAGTTFGYFAKAGGGLGAAKPDFNDSSWRQLDLPHDWAVELPFDERADGNHGFKALGPRFPETSIGWYRKSFDIAAADKGRTIALDFDGVFRNSQVWVNGFYLGQHASGYTSFGYDLSALLNYGGKNVVTVRVDASDNEGWFYEGAGIYRHVWVTKTAPVHVARWGTFVTTEVKGNEAAVTARATVQNDADAPAWCQVDEEIVDPEGKPVVRASTKRLDLGPGASVETASNLPVAAPRLWSCERPTLYTLVTRVVQGGREIDKYETPFGIRTLRWDASQGFFLNGKRVQLKGVCDHQDHAGVGVAIPDKLDAWRLEQLKKMGVNALRTSHNAPNPALLDACDRLGVLVMDENREFGTNAQQLNSLRDLMKRDRNHPSVIIWSLGNEEWNVQWGEKGAAITSRMQAVARTMDPSRRYTQAINSNWGEGSSSVIDVMGFNYLTHGNMDQYHAKFPSKPSVGTEDGSTVSARGIYVSDKAKGLLSAYDVNKLDWSVLAGESVPYYAARPYVAGQFQWTGLDYRGEPTPFWWPNTVSHFGILDLCGFPKDNFYYYRAWWKEGPSLHLFPHWNWPGQEGQPIDVWVHGNTDEVELFLNGKSLGRKPMPRLGHLAWKVPYAKGTLVAKGYRAGGQVLTDTVETTGDPAALRLSADAPTLRADGEDLAVIAVGADDAQGRAIPTASSPVTFEVRGPGRILGVGNGDPVSHEPDQAVGGIWKRTLFSGLAQVIVQSTGEPGEIVVVAKSPGLKDATLRLRASPAQRRPSLP